MREDQHAHRPRLDEAARAIVFPGRGGMPEPEAADGARIVVGRRLVSSPLSTSSASILVLLARALAPHDPVLRAATRSQPGARSWRSFCQHPASASIWWRRELVPDARRRVICDHALEAEHQRVVHLPVR